MFRIFLGVIITLLMYACEKSALVSTPAPLVAVKKIQAVDDYTSIVYPAEIKGRYESALSFQTGGKVLKRYVNAGDYVEKGHILMALDSRDIIENLNISAASLQQAEKQLELVRSDYKRQKQLYESAVISTAVYEQYINKLEEATAARKRAQAQHILNLNMQGYTSLIADSKGVVTAVTSEAGQVVAPGQTVLTFAQTQNREVETFIPENHIGIIQVGQGVQVTLWALPGIIIQGSVREISPSADLATRTYKVRIELLDAPETLKLGMSASVKIIMPLDREYAYTVPSTALYHTKDASYIWVVGGDNQIHRRPVSIQYYKDNAAGIKGDLQGNEMVVISGVHKLRENQQVRQSLSGSDI